MIIIFIIQMPFYLTLSLKMSRSVSSVFYIGSKCTLYVFVGCGCMYIYVPSLYVLIIVYMYSKYVSTDREYKLVWHAKEIIEIGMWCDTTPSLRISTIFHMVYIRLYSTASIYTCIDHKVN